MQSPSKSSRRVAARVRTPTVLVVLLALVGAGTACRTPIGEPSLDSEGGSAVASSRGATANSEPRQASAAENASTDVEPRAVRRARWAGDAKRFLDEHMPERDRGVLPQSLLDTNLEYALRTREQFPWSASVPDELFWNDVLPYAVFDETREAWRPAMYEIAREIVSGASTASEAAQRLNRDLFTKIGVHYDTRRAKPNQNVSESRASGMASCTGLSIALVQACRSVGIPARAVGTPSWSTKPGNHTWVEIWDGDWHFLGADEYDAAGLDRGWFTADAAAARAELPRHRIYATSWKRTGVAFPMVWSEQDSSVAAVDVTDRYTRGRPAPGVIEAVTWVRVFATRGGARVAAELELLDERGRVVASDKSRAGTTDANDMAGFVLPPDEPRNLRVRHGGETRVVDAAALAVASATAANGSRVVELVWSELPRDVAPAEAPRASRPSSEENAARTPPSSATGNDPTSSATRAGGAQIEGRPADSATTPALVELRAWLDRDPAVRGEAPTTPLSRDEARTAVDWLVAARRGQLALERKAETEARAITLGEHTLRWTESTFGDAPEGRRSLWISMHGGGGAPAEVNDKQWKNQGGLYQPTEGIYVAPRAPTNTWNLWHEAHVDGLFARLIEDFVALRGVDPDRVYLMGYSAGGDGVWQLGPRMADHFAAAAMMAGHPNEASLLGLRNLPFAIFMGAEDAAYDRNKVARERAAALGELRAADPDGYEHFVRLYEGLGHWMDRKDAEALPWMAARTRVAWPKKVVWFQDDVVHDDFYWLRRESGTSKVGERVDASIEQGVIRLATNGTKLGALTIELSDDLVDLDQPVTVEMDGKPAFRGLVTRSAATIDASLRRRFDPRRVPTAVVSLAP